MTRRQPIADRFWPKVAKSGPDECWLWTRSLNKYGYGQINSGGRGRPIVAHRVSWEIHFGPIPDGLFVLHHCDNTPCDNPSHLYLGTKKLNSADMIARNRGRGQFTSESLRGNQHARKH